MTKLSYFTDGQAYERMMGRWSQAVGVQFLDWLAAPGGLRWLDVGCGGGSFTELLISHATPNEITGIDPSDAQVAFARARLLKENVKLTVGSALDLPFADASFDAAAMALVLSFLPDPAKAASEMRRIVRPGGWAGTYMWVPKTGSPGIPFIRAGLELGLGKPLPMPGHEAAQLPAMVSLWKQAGFTAVEGRQIDVMARFASFEDFWDSNTALPNPGVHYLQFLSLTEVDRVRTWLREHLPPDSDGGISYLVSSNAVKGRAPGI